MRVKQKRPRHIRHLGGNSPGQMDRISESVTAVLLHSLVEERRLTKTGRSGDEGEFAALLQSPIELFDEVGARD